MKAVVLLSGGLDSATVAAIALRHDFEVHALTVAYGQRHDKEIHSAKRLASALGLHSHEVVQIPLNQFGGSALTDPAIEVPKDRPADLIETEIPTTYVPARNTIMLALALGYAESIGAFDIFIGVNAIDYSGYPDCRPEFIEQFERLANLATKAGVEENKFKIQAPLINMKKSQIIKVGLDLGVDYSLTHSCYSPLPSGKPCLRCDSCQIRIAAFAELGMKDPVT